jgi:hypothetical protein
MKLEQHTFKADEESKKHSEVIQKSDGNQLTKTNPNSPQQIPAMFIIYNI